MGLFWTLAFESPVITIEKVIFGRGKDNVKKVELHLMLKILGSRSAHQKQEAKKANEVPEITYLSDIEKGSSK